MNFFGLDVGTDTIKVVQLAPDGNKFRLVSYGICPAPPKGFASEAQIDLEMLSQSIKKLVRDARMGTSNAAVALSETQVYTRVISTPPLSENELSSAIKWEAEQYIPLPLSEVKLDYQILTQPDKRIQGAMAEVLLVAAPLTVINKYMKVAKMTGLKPVLIETEIISIARALVPPNSPTTVLVNIGAATTEIAVVRNGVLSFTRSITTGGNALSRSIATELNLDMAQAEEYKKSYGLDNTKLSGKVSNALKPVFDIIVQEITRSISFYQKEKGDTATRVILAGGSARLPGAVGYLANVLGIEVLVGDPWLMVNMNDKERANLASDGPMYATAAGLAMKKI